MTLPGVTPYTSFDFVLVGNPVAHSLSPVMHNACYRDLAKESPAFSRWNYHAIHCEDENSASFEMSLVRTGKYWGMNVTMPYKRLALAQADFADAQADAAGGANVLVRHNDFKIYAYNTDGAGAAGAIERVTGKSISDARTIVCGTGPTAAAIAVAFAQAGAEQIALVSRERARSRSCITRAQTSLEEDEGNRLQAMDYANIDSIVPKADIIVDATPRGMQPDDEAIIDTGLLHQGQVVLDTVYGHGVTALVAGAQEQGAFAMDGLEMLVEQAALSVEIWADAMMIDVHVDRNVMRNAASGAQPRI